MPRPTELARIMADAALKLQQYAATRYEKRSERDSARSNHVRMQDQTAHLTAEQHALLRAVVLRGVATARAGLAGLVGIHLHSHRAVQPCRVGHDPRQLREGPLRGVSVGPAWLHRGVLPMRSLAALADAGPVLQAHEAVRVGGHDLPTDAMVAILLQPSLAPGDRDHALGRRASAFVLQVLPQPGLVVRAGTHRCARKEVQVVLPVRGHGEIPLAYVHAHDALMLLRSRVWHRDLQAHQQVEPLMRLVIPDFGGADAGALLDKDHVASIAGVGQDHPPLERQEAHPPADLDAVAPSRAVGPGWRDVLWHFVQAPVALLRRG